MAKATSLAAAAGMIGAVGLLMLVVDLRPAEATFPGKNGRIAYVGVTKKGINIYTIKPGGGGKVKVTDNRTDDSAPSWGSRP